MSNLTGVSLFAGVGGFDLAMERNGVKVVAAVEIDKKCQDVLAHQFPNTKLFDDVTTVKGSDLIGSGFTPSRGIITGGFPCQDLSVAGKRAGLAGERSGLFWEIARVVEETQAEYAILENVPGLLSSNNGADFAVVLGTMADLGYSVAWRVLDAQYFGVPQRRKRVFIACRRASSGSAGEILFKQQGLRRNPTPSQQAGQDFASTSNTSVTLGSGKEIANCLPAELYHHGTVVNQDANNGHVVIESPIVGTLQARDYKGVGNQYVAENKLVVFHPHYHDGARVQDKTMNTLTSRMGTGGNNVSMVARGSNVRRLTPVECERLQGFPDNWTEGQADSHRYKQMGNAVAVPVVEWIIQNICDTV